MHNVCRHWPYYIKYRAQTSANIQQKSGGNLEEVDKRIQLYDATMHHQTSANTMPRSRGADIETRAVFWIFHVCVFNLKKKQKFLHINRYPTCITQKTHKRAIIDVSTLICLSSALVLVSMSPSNVIRLGTLCVCRIHPNTSVSYSVCISPAPTRINDAYVIREHLFALPPPKCKCQINTQYDTKKINSPVWP